MKVRCKRDEAPPTLSRNRYFDYFIKDGGLSEQEGGGGGGKLLSKKSSRILPSAVEF